MGTATNHPSSIGCLRAREYKMPTGPKGQKRPADVIGSIVEGIDRERA
jgi:hypothetical protein